MSEHHKISKQRPIGLWLIIACGVFVVLVLTFHSLEPDNSPASHAQTTQIGPILSIEETDVSSQPDFISSLNEQLSNGVDPQSNAEAALRQILGPNGISPEVRDRYYQMLGIPMPTGDGDYFQSFAEFAGKLRSLSSAIPDLDSVIDQPWSESQYPQIALWLEKNRQHLDDAVAATELSKMYVPLIYDEHVKQGQMALSVLLPALQQHRELSEALRCRAMLSLGQGNAQQAWKDLQACHRLARHVSHGGTLLEAHLGLSIEANVCKADRMIAANGHLTAEEARAMAHEIGQLNPLPNPAWHISHSQRNVFLNSALAMSRAQGAKLQSFVNELDKDKEIEGLERLLIASVDWEEVLRIGNKFYDEFEEAADAPTPQERREKAHELEANIQQRAMETNIMVLLAGSKKQRAQALSAKLLYHLMPAISKELALSDSAVAERDLSRLDLLLVAYRAEHGQYPKSIQALVPNYLDHLPIDPLSNKPYVYQLHGSTGRLYSIGANERDDGGITKMERLSADDLVVELTGS